MAKTKKTGIDSIMSDNDYALMQGYKKSWEQAYEAGDEAGMAKAHKMAEDLRQNYDYSGGESGSEFIKLPSYTQESKTMGGLKSDFSNIKPFEYDPEDDPLYGSYRKQYLREGQRATEDTLGNYAAMTGGLPSTAAVNAASQAGDYYNAQLNDALPELQQLAYSMYLGDIGAKRDNLSMLQGMANDELSNARYDEQWDYNVSQDEEEDAVNRIQTFIKGGGDIDDLDRDLVEASGLTDAELKAMGTKKFNDYNKAMAYLKEQGVPDTQTGSVMSESTWEKRKRSGDTGVEITAYDSYADYLTAYVNYIVGNR
ncbi:MAG: hypothetical protein AB7D36_11545 [Oscillospiraceae bacterium]